MLFVNFLFASVQMTTCSVAPKIVAGSDGEVAVRLTDPDVGGVSPGLVFFATLIDRGFYLSEDKPGASHPAGETGGRTAEDQKRSDGDG